MSTRFRAKLVRGRPRIDVRDDRELRTGLTDDVARMDAADAADTENGKAHWDTPCANPLKTTEKAPEFSQNTQEEAGTSRKSAK
jgi:hypothetical protein